MPGLSAKKWVVERAPSSARDAHGGRVVGSLGAGWFLVSICTSLIPSVCLTRRYSTLRADSMESV